MTVHWVRSHPDVTGQIEPTAAAGGAWRARPRLAGSVALILLLTPLAAGLLSAWLVAGALPTSAGFWEGIRNWLIVLAASMAAVWIASRLTRRALPLPMLLRLGLAFPDRAPARYRIAARAGVTRRLAEQVAKAHETGLADEPTAAAERILTLLAALAAHDPKTRGHCERVRAYTDLISEQLGLAQADQDRLRWAALIHDIGKLDVPPPVLNKPAKLDVIELELVRRHPLRGLAIAAPLAAWLGPWATGIDQHHERFDGSGYPYGLAGEAIGLGARVVAVADAFEVMTAPRPYSRAVPAKTAREELVRCAGTQFDPAVVRAFLDVSLGRLRGVIGPLGWLTAVPFLAGRARVPKHLPWGGQQLASFAAGALGATAIAAAVLAPAPRLGPLQHAKQSRSPGGTARLSVQPAPAVDTTRPTGGARAFLPSSSKPSTQRSAQAGRPPARRSSRTSATDPTGSRPTSAAPPQDQPTGHPAKPVADGGAGPLHPAHPTHPTHPSHPNQPAHPLHPTTPVGKGIRPS